MSLQNEKKMITILKCIIKQPVIKQSRTFVSFSFFIDCCMSVFPRYQVFVNFEKLIRFHQQAFIVYKNWGRFENTDRNISPKTYSF